MTLNEMLTDLNNRIGSEPEISNANMTTWLNEGLLSFCREHEYKWLEKKQTALTISGQAEYALPSDSRRITELRVNDDIYTYVPHERRDLYGDNSKTFSQFGSSFFLNPTPTESDLDIELWYIKRANKLVDLTDSPSDTDIASMPEEYHEALVIYAFATYNTYDEEHDESRALMGNPRQPVPGTYYYYVDMAKREDDRLKRGARTAVLSKQEFIGYRKPNSTARTTTVLGN